MAASLTEPTGKNAGRVTIVTTLTSLIPPVVVSAILILCSVLDIISDEIVGVAILTALGLGAATTGTVFATAKKTPTDQVRTVVSGGFNDQVVPPAPVPPVGSVDDYDGPVVADDVLDRLSTELREEHTR